MPTKRRPAKAPTIGQFLEQAVAELRIREVADFLERLPELRRKVRGLADPGHPHLPMQMAFLAAVVAKVRSGHEAGMPVKAFLEAVVALRYSLHAFDLIPDEIPEIGLADDSRLVRFVLARRAEEFKPLAAKLKVDWKDLSRP